MAIKAHRRGIISLGSNLIAADLQATNEEVLLRHLRLWLEVVVILS